MTIRMPWRRRREVSLALASQRERPPQDLRRAYGRASRTIGEQRGTIARLRTTIRQLSRRYDSALLRAEALADAIGAPGCTPDYVLHVARRAAAARDTDDARWMALVTGTPGAAPLTRDVDTLAKAQRWGDELAPMTSPAGGEDAAAASVPAATGAPTPGDTRAAVAQVLVDHELLADDRCRCGWSARWAGHDILSLIHHPMWHAEHVADQLSAAGLCWRRTIGAAR